GPATQLGEQQRGDLARTVHALAARVDVTQPRALVQLARTASEAAWHAITKARHPGARMQDVAHGDYRTLARAALFAEAMQAKDPEDHVRRAVARAVRERKKSNGMAKLPIDDGDPLRTLLDVPARGRVALPKNDVRMRIAQAADGSLFGAALRHAARFAEDVIRPAIGEELWSLCKPVAFSDKAESRVIVEVRSSLLAHEVQLRSQELVHRLAKVHARVNAIKIVVVAPATLPVLR
ncbi:MAG TPA: DciA family protein, partial [Myxococcota bacterium]